MKHKANKTNRGRKLINLSGERFGMLTVIERAANKNKAIRWKCKCDCGKTKIILPSNLKTGNTKSCGCVIFSFKDLAKQKFGRLTVIKRTKRPKNYKTGIFWLWKCECGKKVIVNGGALKNGRTKSCGCYKREQSSIVHLIDLTCKKFGNLIVIRRAKNHITNQEPKWLCKCVCGKKKIVFGSNLRRGKSKSCGCKRNTKKKC